VVHCGIKHEGGYLYAALAHQCGHRMDRMPPPLASERGTGPRCPPTRTQAVPFSDSRD
jgi:hypothetical protein